MIASGVLVDPGAQSSIPIPARWRTADNPNTSSSATISEMVLYPATRQVATPYLRAPFALRSQSRTSSHAANFASNYQSKLMLRTGCQEDAARTHPKMWSPFQHRANTSATHDAVHQKSGLRCILGHNASGTIIEPAAS